MDKKIVDVDEAYLDEVINRLSILKIDLDDDPLMFGPKRLNSKVALCRAHIDVCMTIYLQLSSDLRRMMRLSRTLEMDYQIKQADLLANNQDVRAQDSIKDRLAFADMKLSDLRKDMMLVDAAVKDLGGLLTVVNKKKEDLKDVQNQLKSQIKLCQEVIEKLHGQWGSAPSQDGVGILSVPDRPKTSQSDVLAAYEADEDLSDLDKFVLEQTGIRPVVVSLQDKASQDETPQFFEEKILKASEEEMVPTSIELSGEGLPEEDDTASVGDVDDFFSQLDSVEIPDVGEKVNHPDTNPQEINIDDLLADLF